LKFKTRSSIILNRFESFTKDMTASMAGLPLPSASIASAVASTEDVEMKEAPPVIAGKGAAAASSAASGGGAGNKKKKKKGGKK
jgi:signal recognition particle subunit SRP9